MQQLTTTAEPALPTTPRWYAETPVSFVAATLLAVVGSVVLGGLTSVGQTYLPPALSSATNSAGVWTLLAVGLVWAGRARPLLGALLGVVALEGLVEGYAMVSGWRGHFYAAPFSGLFSLVGLVAGPLVGVAAALTRHHNPVWRGLSLTPLVAVLLGEGTYGLTYLRATTSPFFWEVELVLGASVLAVSLARRPLDPATAMSAVGLSLLGAAVFVAAYSLLGAG